MSETEQTIETAVKDLSNLNPQEVADHFAAKTNFVVGTVGSEIAQDVTSVSSIISELIGGLHTIISAQAKELAPLRELEHHVTQQVHGGVEMVESTWESIKQRLAGVRAENSVLAAGSTEAPEPAKPVETPNAPTAS